MQEIIEPVGLTLLYANHKIAPKKSDSTKKPKRFYKFTEAKAKDCILETDRFVMSHSHLVSVHSSDAQK
jgi:hypothetical protein